MSKYRKYIEIIDKLDKALETKGAQLLEGKVTKDTLEFLEKVLHVMEQAWRVAWQVDCLEDISKAMGAIARQGQGAGSELAPAGEETIAYGGARQGRDFRRGSDDPALAARAFGGATPDLWPLAAYSVGDRRSRGEEEEYRRGRRMDGMERHPERDFVFLPGFGVPTPFGVPFGALGARMGYHVDPHTPEDNAPYSQAENNNSAGRARSGIQVPLQNAASGSKPATAAQTAG